MGGTDQTAFYCLIELQSYLHGAEVVERYIKSQEDLSLEGRLDNLRRY
jgi:hypothetical protein